MSLDDLKEGGTDTGPDVFDSTDGAVVYPLLTDDDAEQQLVEWFAAHDAYGLADTSQPVSDAEFDLCLVDTNSIRAHGETLAELKSSATPVFVPVLLVLPEATGEVLDDESGEIVDDILTTTVDEVVSRPLQEAELAWRLKTLLRMRRQLLGLQRRQAELRLFRQTAEDAGHAIYITDTDGTIEYINPAFEELTGYTRSEAVGETPRLLDSGEMSAEYFENLWETITAGDVWEEEILNQRKDGTLYTANQTISPVTGDDGIRAFVAVQTDITQRREREQLLAQRTRAIEKAPIGISISDPTQADNPLTYVNEAFVELTGYSREAATGRNCRFLQGENTDPERVAEIRRAIDAEQPVSVELRNYRKDGTEFWNRLDIAPVHDDDGEVVNWVGFQQDITGRKQRENQLSVLDRVLRHNLRNDMNVIRGWAEQIQAVSEGDAAAYADRILDTSDQLLTAVEKERAITEILTERPHHQTLDLCIAVEQTVAAVERDYPDASITVSCPDGVTVSASTELDRAIRELLDNAVAHSDRERPTVSVTVAPGSEMVRLAIADDGPPIPEMERGVLAGERERTPTYHGSGLGLWLVNLIVTRSGGQVTCEPREPRGNVVRLLLPRAEEPTQAR
jgi:PAS domain S-box-containing protein